MNRTFAGEAEGHGPEDADSAHLRLAVEAYRKEALSLILRKANQVARELDLPEDFPITRTNLIEVFISPPWFARDHEAIGNATTDLYRHGISRGNKLSHVVGIHQAEDSKKWEKHYLWPLSQLDTNAAYQLATQWLQAASIDVKALNRDYRLIVKPDKYYGRPPSGSPDKFIPVYCVGWYKPFKPPPPSIVVLANEPPEWEPVARIRLFAPTRTLMELRVEDPKYILRAPVVLTNLDAAIPERR